MCIRGRAHLIHVVAFDLDANAGGRELPGALYGQRDIAAQCGEMIILDQDLRFEVGAVVHAAAAAHGVLLQRAPSRRGLARVEDLRARAAHGMHIARGERRNAGEVLHEVERDAFSRDQGARGSQK